MKNIIFTKNYLKENNINIDFGIPEATYLLWLDFSKINLSHEEIKELLLRKAKIALNDGVSFGNNGDKYFRLNCALSKKALNTALIQLSNSLKQQQYSKVLPFFSLFRLSNTKNRKSLKCVKNSVQSFTNINKYGRKCQLN